MKKLASRHFISAVLLVTVIAGLLLDKAGAFHFLELKNYDSRVNLCASSRRVSDDIIFIMVDQSSITEASERYGWTWPWPRETYGRILEYLDEGNAATCTYDILFTEPSAYGDADDEAFAKSLAGCKNTKPVLAKFWDGDEEEPAILEPLELFAKSAAFVANTTSITDSDDIIRRTRITNTVDGEELTFMGFVPPLLLGDSLDNLPYQKDGTLKLNYKGNIDDYSHYTAMELLKSIEAVENGEEPDLDCNNFQNAHVFVIYYAPGLFDICSTPINKVYPGSGVSMTALDNYLTDSFIVSAGGFVNFLLMVIFAVLGTLGSFWFGKQKSTVKSAVALLIFYALGLALILVLVYGLFLFRVDIKFITLLFAFVFSSLAMDSITFVLEGKQKRFIKGAFSQYLSPAVINQLIENPEGLKLGGEKRNISIFFSDVQSFTTLSEGLSPESLTDLLNVYLSAMSSIILKSGGTIDKYEGDAIIAFWNAPVDIPDHSLKALMAAVECQETLSQMEDFFVKKVGRPMWTRIGLNTGDAVVGNMGSESRFDYTMFGDSVNLASRLEGLNKQFGTYLMCSEATKLQAEESSSAGSCATKGESSAGQSVTQGAPAAGNTSSSAGQSPTKGAPAAGNTSSSAGDCATEGGAAISSCATEGGSAAGQSPTKGASTATGNSSFAEDCATEGGSAAAENSPSAGHSATNGASTAGNTSSSAEYCATEGAPTAASNSPSAGHSATNGASTVAGNSPSAGQSPFNGASTAASNSPSAGHSATNGASTAGNTSYSAEHCLSQGTPAAASNSYSADYSSSQCATTAAGTSPSACPLYFRPLGRVQVVGKTEAIAVYEPLTLKTAAEKKEALDLFAQGLELFYEGHLEEAAEIFRSNTSDAPSQKYAEKCAAILKTSGWQENWQGIWVADGK